MLKQGGYQTKYYITKCITHSGKSYFYRIYNDMGKARGIMLHDKRSSNKLT